MTSRTWSTAVLAISVAVACTWESSLEELRADPLRLTVRLDAAGAAVPEPVELEPGRSVQLEVVVETEDGARLDLTRDPRVHYLSLSPHLLSVDSTGLVKALERPAAAEAPLVPLATVLVVFTDPAEADRELTRQVGFSIPGREEAAAQGRLQIRAPRSSLGLGESMQLEVVRVQPDGSRIDVTAAAGTTYQTTSESQLVPEPDGRVTCIGTRGRQRSVASIIARHDGLIADLDIRLLAEGPGAGLTVAADPPAIALGQSTQLRVERPRPDGTVEDLTAAASGTLYLAFPGHGRLDPSVLSVDEHGAAHAGLDFGRGQRREVVVYARNGDDVGWTFVTIHRSMGSGG